MKTLTITMPYVARINAVAILDAQRGNVGLVRTCAALAARIELDAAERAAVRYQTVTLPNGNEVPAWDASARLEDRSFELSAEEARRLRQVVAECEHLRRKDLTWVEPLLAQLEV